MAAQNLTAVHAYNSVSYPFTLTRNGSAINLDGAKIYFTVKKNKDDTDAEATFQIEKTSFTNPSSGADTIVIPKATMDIDPATYFYDVQLIESDGTLTTLGFGEFPVLERVTEAVT